MSSPPQQAQIVQRVSESGLLEMHSNSWIFSQTPLNLFLDLKQFRNIKKQHINRAFSQTTKKSINRRNFLPRTSISLKNWVFSIVKLATFDEFDLVLEEWYSESQSKNEICENFIKNLKFSNSKPYKKIKINNRNKWLLKCWEMELLYTKKSL